MTRPVLPSAFSLSVLLCVCVLANTYTAAFYAHMCTHTRINTRAHNHREREKERVSVVDDILRQLLSHFG